MPPRGCPHMKQEKAEYLIKKFHLKYSLPVILTVISICFWVTFLSYDWTEVTGLVINIAGLAMWWSAKLTLAKNWNVGFGRPKISRLVTHGIYSKICHPMYWGINLTLAGLVILYPNLWFSTASLLIIIYFFSRMRIENNYLSEQLGEEYRNYKRKTWL